MRKGSEINTKTKTKLVRCIYWLDECFYSTCVALHLIPNTTQIPSPIELGDSKLTALGAGQQNTITVEVWSIGIWYCLGNNRRLLKKAKTPAEIKGVCCNCLGKRERGGELWAEGNAPRDAQWLPAAMGRTASYADQSLCVGFMSTYTHFPCDTRKGNLIPEMVWGTGAWIAQTMWTHGTMRVVMS